jgi:hypothetical protein
MKRLRDELIAREKELERIHTLEKTLLAISHHINNAIAPISARAQVCRPDNVQDVRKLIDACNSGTARVTQTIQILTQAVEWMKTPAKDESFQAGPLSVNDMVASLSENPLTF